ncbi:MULTISPECIES: MerR family transcriptional regulator [unclassified Nocardioides]|uniref:MerR family transcriptional regulator n=1 Tax=unclassified Nocardioides TaxID=2615069 RepID=UPI0002EFAD32|nr:MULTISPECIES: MerR family transcriptional regulator [unclassified Nocardioides]
MTVGELSRRTGVPAKNLRAYTDAGLVYSVGRTGANYRLYDAEALWCVAAITELRQLGLTLAEIREFGAGYLAREGEPIGPRLAQMLERSRARVEQQIAELEEVRRRIDDFVAANRDRLRSHAARAWAGDPRGRDPRP